MAIKRIKVSNFKSFKELDLELGNFNVIIGANASGKSNFTQIFKFLTQIEENSLNDVISMHGGLESLRNLKIGSASDFEMQIQSDSKFGWGAGHRALKIHEITYQFSLRFDRSGNGYKIASDKLTQKFEIARLKTEENVLFEDEDLGRGEFTVCNVDGKPELSFNPPGIKDLLEEEEVFPPLSFFPKLFGEEIPSETLLIRTPYSIIPPWESLFGDIAIYDIDPHIARNPVQITGKAELAENGENLALVLDKLVEDKDKKRKFCNLMKDLLPFFDDINTEKFAERSVLIKLRENYYKDDYLRAYMLSDGTINITALLIALYFEEKDIIIVEEPERNMHPHLISKLMDMMKDASKNKQIIVTTHSSEVVKHAGLENLLLVSRDKGGFSTISRPGEKEEVKIFLENELGLDELYVQNLLAV
ncbi:MAG: AAA family ATPase [Planctomycetes bacterium]|nr:AAA family ATPase [Planctomycetota bacterium]MCH8118597.1 AAA family ATPase [Planctomycetota bacterium]